MLDQHMIILSRDWEVQQIRGFTQVCRKHLAKRNIPFNSVETDFRDGNKLLHFLEIISKTKINEKWNINPRNVFFQIDNINIAFKFLNEKGVDLTGISAKDIQEGNVKLTLGLVFKCIKKFQIDKIEDDKQKAINALLSWCKRNTIGYDVEITDFQKSWKNGLAFCALIHNFYRNLFNFNSLTPSNPSKNWKTFVETGRSLGITVCFEVGDTNCESSDLIILQVNEIYLFINQKEKLQVFIKPIAVMKDLSEIPLNVTLKQNFSRLYQTNNTSVQSLQQQYNNKDPNVNANIQALQTKMKKDISNEIKQLLDYVKKECNSKNDQEMYKKIRQHIDNLISNHGEYLREDLVFLKSITNIINDKLTSINYTSDYQLLYDQIIQFFKDMKNRFEIGLKNKNLKSSDLNSFLKEAQEKISLLNFKYKELKNLNVQINEYLNNPDNIQNQFGSFLQEVKDKLNDLIAKEQKAAEYCNKCEPKLKELEKLRQSILI